MFLAEVFRVAQFGNGDNLERHVVADAFGIVVDASLKVLVVGLANKN